MKLILAVFGIGVVLFAIWGVLWILSMRKKD
jgi:hypothetical protein